jgi:molybdate transport system substrate-binding protein
MKRTVVTLIGLVAALTACSSTPPSGSGGPTQLTVFAASSLTGAFTQIGRGFEASNPGVSVTYNFGPSDGLAGQIESEGTADVFASASERWMDDVAAKAGVSHRVDFAQNRLVIITPTNDPAHIASLEDLARPGVKLVLAAPGVPVGDYARQVLTTAGIEADAEKNVVSDEPDDASVVAKIGSGEADVGIVYVSDVSAAATTDVRSVPIHPSVNVVATYPIAIVNGAGASELGARFIDYVEGPEGRDTLRAFGFSPPPSPTTSPAPP